MKPISTRIDRTAAIALGRRAVLALAASGLALSFSMAAASAQTVTVWSGYPEMEPFYKKVGEGLKKKYPNLQVSVQAIPLREHEKRLALALPSNSAAEIIELANSTAQRYIEAGLMKAAPDDAAKFVGNTAFFDSFVQKTATVGGKVYGMPLFRGQGALYYNTDMYAKAGLSGPPKTMEDFTSYATKLTQRDAQGQATVSGWSLRLSGGGAGIAEKFWINMFQYGGNLIEEQPDGKWITTYASEAGRKALKQYLENVHTLKNVTPEMPADADAFEREQTAMFIRESWVIGDIAQKAPNLKFATAALPRGTIVAPVVPLYGRRRREGPHRVGLRAWPQTSQRIRVAARQCRLAAQPQGCRLLEGRRGQAGLQGVCAIAAELRVLYASGHCPGRGGPYPPRRPAREGLRGPIVGRQ